MPLDPQAQALVDQAAAEGRPSHGEMTLEESRQSIVDSIPLAGSPEEVARVENRTIPGPAGQIPVRIYTPRNAAPLPGLVFFHGGGWVIGNLDTVDTPLRALANRSGCVVISVDYRLAPEHQFPAAADDCYAATCWAVEHASSIGVDPARVAVGGDSAGGNLAAVVSLMARDRGAPPLAFQLLIYPVADHDFGTPSYLANADGFLLSRGSMIWFWDQYAPSPADRDHPYASPLRAEKLDGLPPAHVVTAEYDPLRDEGEAYAARLARQGVPTTARRYDGMIHGFFSRAGVLDQGKQLIDDCAAALRTALA